MSTLVVSLALSFLAATPADATRKDIQDTFGFVPEFMKKMPDRAIVGAWEEMRGVRLNPVTGIPQKYKELIGLAVAAQTPSEQSVYGHTQFAKLYGATDAEIAEAIMVGATARQRGTIIQGLAQDEAKFKVELTKVVAGMKKNAAVKPIEVVDAKTALTDIEQRWGVVPEFLRQFPSEGVAGAWKMERDFASAGDTAIPPLFKSLIGLAVASTIPCENCVVAETAFARLSGATDRELHEAIAMGSLVRGWSTWFTGMQIDQAAYRRDVDRMVKEIKRGLPKNNPS
jgi:AhpD family alkylhydroperoxidase